MHVPKPSQPSIDHKFSTANELEHMYEQNLQTLKETLATLVSKNPRFVREISEVLEKGIAELEESINQLKQNSEDGSPNRFDL